MTQVENPHAGQGPVLLDVGGEFGALLVRMPGSMEGVEVEIRSHDNRGHTVQVTHVEVLARPTPAGVMVCAVFPSLLQGSYELYQRRSGPVRLQVTIAGGQVSQASWPFRDAEGQAERT
jgi:hypothetical protein